jgi:hypothetical protein
MRGATIVQQRSANVLRSITVIFRPQGVFSTDICRFLVTVNVGALESGHSTITTPEGLKPHHCLTSHCFLQVERQWGIIGVRGQPLVLGDDQYSGSIVQ